MQIFDLKSLLETKDVLGYIKAGADDDIYDPVASVILEQLRTDLTLSQLQDIIWEAFYQEFCGGNIHDSQKLWMLDRSQAVNIIGYPTGFKSLAMEIRLKFDKF
jgi:hypothetical protein